MAIELVTGHAGQEHVSSADAGRFNAGVCGTGKYVLDTGLKFAYSIESANLIRIASGDAVNQGRHITIPPNTYEDAALLNGAQGKTRIDVITLRYSKVTRQVDSETVTLEEASVEVVKGTEVPTGTTPEVPDVISGNIFGGATADDMPLYYVLITDTSVTSVTPVFTVMPSISGLQSEDSDLRQGLANQQNTLADLSADVASINGNIDDLTERVTAVEGNIPEHIEYTWQYTAIGINANGAYSDTKRIGIDGYTPVSILGFRVLDNDTNGKNGAWCVIPRMWIYSNALDFSIWNQHPSEQAVVKVQIKIGYVSDYAT